MTLFEQIKKDRINAMKSKDKVRSNLLGCIIAESSVKNKNPDDNTVKESIKEIIKKSLKTKTIIAGSRDTTSLDDELKILYQYVPARISDDELREFIKTTWATLDCENKVKFGKIMLLVKSKYGQNVDMATASAIVREIQ